MSPIRVYIPTRKDEGHYVYQVAHETPPNGVTYVFDDEGNQTSISRFTCRLRDTLSSVKPLVRFYNRYWTGTDVSQLGRRTPEYDIYHNRSVARIRSEPWVQECEHVGPLMGERFREQFDNPEVIERVGDALASGECKAIIPHTRAAADSIRKTIPDSGRFEEKLEPVPLAYEAPDEARAPKEGSVQFLFVGSSYFDDQFYIKGGDKVLRAYDRIREDINGHLVVRSDIPEEYIDEYGPYDDIDLVTNVIPREDLESLYDESDVFVFPSAQGTPGAVFREAMGHTLAVIGLDIWGNNELISNGETGYLVEPDRFFTYVYPRYNVPVVGSGNYFRGKGSYSMDDIVSDLTCNDGALVERLSQKMKLLAEDYGRRRRMAIAGRERVTKGKLSLDARNEKLERIYRQAAEG